MRRRPEHLVLELRIQIFAHPRGQGQGGGVHAVEIGQEVRNHRRVVGGNTALHVALGSRPLKPPAGAVTAGDQQLLPVHQIGFHVQIVQQAHLHPAAALPLHAPEQLHRRQIGRTLKEVPLQPPEEHLELHLRPQLRESNELQHPLQRAAAEEGRAEQQAPLGRVPQKPAREHGRGDKLCHIPSPPPVFRPDIPIIAHPSSPVKPGYPAPRPVHLPPRSA